MTADLLPDPAGILTTVLTLAAVTGIAAYFSGRIIRSVENIGESYTDLYKKQHREVMDALQSETRKTLAETKSLVMEHTELERILKALAERAEEEEEAL